MKKFLSTIAAAAALTLTATPASAGSNRITVGDAKAELMPRNFIGVKANDLRGDYVALKASYPMEATMQAELHPLRVSYLLYSMDMRTGKGQFSSAVMLGYMDCDYSLDLAAIISGLRAPDDNIRVILLSTQAQQAFDLNGRAIEGFDPKKFRSDANYRQQVMMQGTATTAVQQITDAREAFDKWTVYTTPDKYEVATPLQEEQLRIMATMNPAYNFGQKFMASFRGTISPDLTSTAIGLGFDVIGALSVKPQGLDFKSNSDRMTMGWTIAWTNALHSERDNICS